MSGNSSDERIFARSHTCNVVARDAKGEGARRGVQTSVRLALLCGKKVKLHHARRRAVAERRRGDAHPHERTRSAGRLGRPDAERCGALESALLVARGICRRGFEEQIVGKRENRARAHDIRVVVIGLLHLHVEAIERGSSVEVARHFERVICLLRETRGHLLCHGAAFKLHVETLSHAVTLTDGPRKLSILTLGRADGDSDVRA